MNSRTFTKKRKIKHLSSHWMCKAFLVNDFSKFTTMKIKQLSGTRVFALRQSFQAGFKLLILLPLLPTLSHRRVPHCAQLHLAYFKY